MHQVVMWQSCDQQHKHLWIMWQSCVDWYDRI